MNNYDPAALKDVIKPDDSWWTTVFPARAANRLVGVLADTDITPNQVTLLSTLLAVVAATSLATGEWVWMLLGAILLQASFILDCADGQLARYIDKCSFSGAWLDTATDILKNFAFFFGLTAGAVKSAASPQMWAWGFMAYFLSVGTMFLYAIRPERLKKYQSNENITGTDSFLESFYAWAKKNAYFLSFSVPDQLLVISIGATINLPEYTLILLVIWGTPAMLFSLLRTWFRIKNIQDKGLSGIENDTE